VKTLLAMGLMGVCWADACSPEKMNTAIRDMVLMADIYMLFSLIIE